MALDDIRIILNHKAALISEGGLDMANVRPGNFVIRCYGYQPKKGFYVGVCLDFNLSVEASSPEQLKQKMKEVIISYIETVLDTNDKESIADLLKRRAPIRDWVFYYVIKFLLYLRKFPGNFTFNEIVPFHLAHNC